MLKYKRRKGKKRKEVLKMMGRKIKEKTLYLGLKFVDNLDLPKDYRLVRDILPPNIQ